MVAVAASARRGSATGQVAAIVWHAITNAAMPSTMVRAKV